MTPRRTSGRRTYGGVANLWVANGPAGPVLDWTLGKLNMDTFVYSVVVGTGNVPFGRSGAFYATYGTRFYNTWVFVSGGGGSGQGPVPYLNWGANARVIVASPCPDESSVVSCLLTAETALSGFSFHCVVFPRVINAALNTFPSCRLTANSTGAGVSQPTLASAAGDAGAHAFRFSVLEDAGGLDPAGDGFAVGCAFSKNYASKGGNLRQAFTDPAYVLRAECGNNTVNGTFLVPRGSTFTCNVTVWRTVTGLAAPIDPITTSVLGYGKLAPTLVSFSNWTGAVASSEYTLSITRSPASSANATASLALLPALGTGAFDSFTATFTVAEAVGVAASLEFRLTVNGVTTSSARYIYHVVPFDAVDSITPLCSPGAALLPVSTNVSCTFASWKSGAAAPIPAAFLSISSNGSLAGVNASQASFAGLASGAGAPAFSAPSLAASTGPGYVLFSFCPTAKVWNATAALALGTSASPKPCTLLGAVRFVVVAVPDNATVSCASPAMQAGTAQQCRVATSMGGAAVWADGALLSARTCGSLWSARILPAADSSGAGLAFELELRSSTRPTPFSSGHGTAFVVTAANATAAVELATLSDEALPATTLLGPCNGTSSAPAPAPAGLLGGTEVYLHYVPDKSSRLACDAMNESRADEPIWAGFTYNCTLDTRVNGLAALVNASDVATVASGSGVNATGEPVDPAGPALGLASAIAVRLGTAGLRTGRGSLHATYRGAPFANVSYVAVGVPVRSETVFAPAVAGAGASGSQSGPGAAPVVLAGVSFELALDIRGGGQSLFVDAETLSIRAEGSPIAGTARRRRRLAQEAAGASPSPWIASSSITASRVTTGVSIRVQPVAGYTGFLDITVLQSAPAFVAAAPSVVGATRVFVAGLIIASVTPDTADARGGAAVTVAASPLTPLPAFAGPWLIPLSVTICDQPAPIVDRSSSELVVAAPPSPAALPPMTWCEFAFSARL
eukprot:tig00000911_g5404.t1